MHRRAAIASSGRRRPEKSFSENLRGKTGDGVNAQPLAFHLLSKPTGATCNLDCQYCFFLSKQMLYPGDRFRMSDQMLETYIRQLLQAQPADEVNVAWQGGEPTLMGLDFFIRSIEYVEKYRKPDQRILHTMQTSGTLLNDAWCAFFKEHNFLIGLSVDGPKEMHDAYRVNKGAPEASIRSCAPRSNTSCPTVNCLIFCASPRRTCSTVQLRKLCRRSEPAKGLLSRMRSICARTSESGGRH